MSSSSALCTCPRGYACLAAEIRIKCRTSWVYTQEPQQTCHACTQIQSRITKMCSQTVKEYAGISSLASCSITTTPSVHQKFRKWDQSKHTNWLEGTHLIFKETIISPWFLAEKVKEQCRESICLFVLLTTHTTVSSGMSLYRILRYSLTSDKAVVWTRRKTRDKNYRADVAWGLWGKIVVLLLTS
jgi:hypothetical protein